MGGSVATPQPEDSTLLAVLEAPTALTNWSKTGDSSCYVLQARDTDGVRQALAAARARYLPVISRGAGHSYTDAAWNTGGVVIDMTAMHRILSWDPERGIMQVEPGVTLRDMLQVAWKDGWWPFATPSTPEVTIGGCAAMNVMGKNAWQCGSFGDHLLAVDVLLASGDVLTLTPARDSRLFQVFVGGLGLLGIFTSLTIQLQRLPSDQVAIHRYVAASLAELFRIFADRLEESDFIEGWVDGFACGEHLGRGQVTTASMSATGGKPPFRFPATGEIDRLEVAILRRLGGLSRPLFLRGVPVANRIKYWQGRWSGSQQRSLLPYTYYSPAAFAGYHVSLPQGVETFHAFLPADVAEEIFTTCLRNSQREGCVPIWCIVKRHRADSGTLLSYQLDGYSVELNYPRLSSYAPTLRRLLRRQIEMVIEAGGRFYLAKDHYLTGSQYRRSVGDEVVDTFLALKQEYDPNSLLQSDLYRRLFQTP
jgi:decaprenylphospho-beta-D-ribofuranose 2-oxidase